MVTKLPLLMFVACTSTQEPTPDAPYREYYSCDDSMLCDGQKYETSSMLCYMPEEEQHHLLVWQGACELATHQCSLWNCGSVCVATGNQCHWSNGQ